MVAFVGLRCTLVDWSTTKICVQDSLGSLLDMNPSSSGPKKQPQLVEKATGWLLVPREIDLSGDGFEDELYANVSTNTLFVTDQKLTTSMEKRVCTGVHCPNPPACPTARDGWNTKKRDVGTKAIGFMDDGWDMNACPMAMEIFTKAV